VHPIILFLRIFTHHNMGLVVALILITLSGHIKIATAEESHDALLNQNTISLQTVVVNASRADTKLNEMTQNTSVISSEDIEHSPQKTIDQILKNQAGILLNDQPFYEKDPTGQSINIRGLGSARSLVLIDGIPALDAMYGTVQWNLAPVSSIQNVEIIRGGVSNLYGNYGMGGVINITTKPISQDAGVIEGGYGTFNTSNLAASKDWSLSDSTRIRLSADNFNTRGYLNYQKFSYPLGATFHQGMQAEWANNYNMRAQGEVDLGSGIKSFVKTGYHFMENPPGGGYPGFTKKTEEYSISAGIKIPLGDKEKLDANTFYENSRLDQQNANYGASPSYTPYLTAGYTDPYSMVGASIQYSNTHPSLLIDQLIVGLDARQNMANNTTTTYTTTGVVNGGAYASGQQQFYGALFQASKTLPTLALTFTLSLREDLYQSQVTSFTSTAYSSGVAGATSSINAPNINRTASSPTIGLLYKLDHETSLRAAAYQAFHAPGLNNMVRSYGSSVTSNTTVDGPSTALKYSFSNPLLTPETMKGFELGLDWRGEEDYFQITGFHAMIHNAVTSLNATASQLASYCPGFNVSTPKTNPCTYYSGITSTAAYSYGNSSNGSTVYGNGATLFSYGAEIQAHHEFNSRWSADGSFTHTNTTYTWVDASLISSNPLNMQLGGIPRNMGYIAFTYSPKQSLSLSGDMRVVGQSWTDNKMSSRLPAYTIFDVKANYQWNPRTSSYLSITNLGDLHYATYGTSAGILGEPFVIMTGTKYNF